MPGSGEGALREPGWLAFVIDACAQLIHGCCTGADDSTLGASLVVKGRARNLATPKCERRCMSSAACDDGRRAMCEVAPIRWMPNGRLVTPDELTATPGAGRGEASSVAETAVERPLAVEPGSTSAAALRMRSSLIASLGIGIADGGLEASGATAGVHGRERPRSTGGGVGL